ncbi:hypothetical protein T06_9209 [Trichinella sp. T6]|nr:hypothetical protein T06_9209 [Trichinella sp. T6]
MLTNIRSKSKQNRRNRNRRKVENKFLIEVAQDR